MPREFLVRAVGVVRSPWLTRAEVDPAGGPARIEVLAAYATALEGLELSSQVLVVAYLHLADRTVLRARPRRHATAAPERGVFATRSPDRPNPLAVTRCQLLRREGLTLFVTGCDLLDGTPVVDLKPGGDGHAALPGAGSGAP